jgi:hypothetical protein
MGERKQLPGLAALWVAPVHGGVIQTEVSLSILSGFSLRSERFILCLGGLSLRSKPLSLSVQFLTKEKEKEKEKEERGKRTDLGLNHTLVHGRRGGCWIDYR